MKILLIRNHFHHKNLAALRKYKNITVDEIDFQELNQFDLSQYNCIYSPALPICVENFSSSFLFGPHFSVFPEQDKCDLITYKNKKTSYIVLSDWNKKTFSNFPVTKNFQLEDVPFGVDTDTFKETLPIQERQKVFIYYKRRDPHELEFVKKFLDSKGIQYQLFNYESRYNEKDYIDCLSSSKYGIWVGSHESQGFALQEALSCNVPLLIWNVRSMHQEYKSSYQYIPATTIPYWDERCGEYFYEKDEFEIVFDKFIACVNTYQPRQYVLENLSIDVCEKKFMEMVNRIE